MAGLEKMLFEDPSALYWAFSLAQIVMLTVLYCRRTRRIAALTLIPAALAAGTALTAMLVTTERERLGHAAAELVLAVHSADTAALEMIVAPDYADGRHDKAKLLRAADEAAESLGLTGAEITATLVEITGDEGTVRLWVTAEVVGFSSGGGSAAPTVWTLWWSKQDGRWRLSSARLDKPGGLPGAPRGPSGAPRP